MKMTYKQIQNWFGNRGIIVNDDDLKKWGNNDKYIYWIPNNKKAVICLTQEEDQKLGKTLMYVSIKNMWMEIEDECLIVNAPFEVNWSKD